MIEELRAHLAYMAVDMPPAERAALGLDADRTARLRELVNEGRPGAAAALVPDALLERYAVRGSRGQVVARLDALRERVQPEMLVFDADDYSVAFLERLAAVARDAGIVTRDPRG